MAGLTPRLVLAALLAAALPWAQASAGPAVQAWKSE